jgi:hypothetical protein
MKLSLPTLKTQLTRIKPSLPRIQPNLPAAYSQLTCIKPRFTCIKLRFTSIKTLPHPYSVLGRKPLNLPIYVFYFYYCILQRTINYLPYGIDM